MGQFNSKPANKAPLATQLVERPDAAPYSPNSNSAYSSSTGPGGPLDDSMQLLAEDVEWLDESELLNQEDDDLRLSKQVSGASLEEWLRSREDRNLAVNVTDPQLVKKYFGARVCPAGGLAHARQAAAPWTTPCPRARAR
jgi:hypothetical protein